MKTPKVSPVEAVKTSYPQLAEENKLLQQTISDLAETISRIQDSLHRIKLQVSAWHQIAGGIDDNFDYKWSRDIGYTRTGDEWHIALRRWSCNQDNEVNEKTYTFSQAPPWMIIEAAGKIPGLLDELIERTRDTRAQLTKKKSEVDELAAVLDELADEAMQAEG
jgi:methyl-accepting chemotaxis protein